MASEGGRAWMTVTEVVALLGVSRRRVLAALRSGALAGRRARGNLWLVDREAVLVWSLSRPAPTGVARLRGDRYVSADGRSHVELIDGSGLGDWEVAARLGVSVGRVVRWRERGVPNVYVARLRALAGPAGVSSSSGS